MSGGMATERRSRGGGFEPIGSILDSLFARTPLEEKAREAEATDRWAAVAGPEIARRSRAVGVRRGELIVEVRGSVWMGHVAVLRQAFLRELNARLPESARIRAIRLQPMRGKEE